MDLGREACPNARFSTMFAMSEFYAASLRPADVWARYERRREQYAMAGGGYPHCMDKVWADY